MRLLRASLALAVALSPQAALACGAMVSDQGRAELLGFEALLEWDGATSTEELLVSVDFQSADPTFGWLMPLPVVPNIEEGDLAPIEEALAITAPPIVEDEDRGEGAGSGPPVVGAGPGGVEVAGRETIRGLRFVILEAIQARSVGRWMRKHNFAFHDRQEPVLQRYLDRGWVIVAARVASRSLPRASLVPVRFSFETAEPVYPLAMAGSGHQGLELGMTIFVLSPFRPTSTTYEERVVTPDPQTGFDAPGSRLELRYSAPLGDQSGRMEASPDTWLTRYEATFSSAKLDRDLVLARSTDQTAIDYSDIAEGNGIVVWLTRIGVMLIALILAVWISIGMARRRRTGEAPKMPTQGPTG